MDEPVVSIKQGELKGVTDTDLNGDTFYKFLGIPYAKPPIGPLRFKAPQLAEPWTGIRDATKEGNQCISMDFITNKPEGSEDCLYLNIFSKELPKAGLSPKPVMVFIHGGGFIGGSGSQQIQGAKYLVAEDVVLVTINYRLGIFGFLSSDDLSLEVPGNAALKDQTLALKWVQENIASFNGDSNNVTLFGISAGGASVHFQVLSPTANGLFHKAIAQSGSALNPWAWGQKNIVQVAMQLGKNVSNDKDGFDILMNVSAEELYQASLKIPDNLLNASERRPFGPVIEKPNPTAFLTENPSDLLASGKFNQVPLIQGNTSKEGLIAGLGGGYFLSKMDLKEVGIFWNLDIERNSQIYAKLKAKLNNYYFSDGESEDAIHKMIGDVNFLVGTIESARLAARTSKCPVYLYVFSYETPETDGLAKLYGYEPGKYNGVAHGADLLFLFNSESSATSELLKTMKDEQKTGIKKITKIWTDFARTGRPHELWEPVTDVNELKYFNIDKDPKLEENPFAERVAVWDEFLENVSINAYLQEKTTF